jgi:hypothetical protein
MLSAAVPSSSQGLKVVGAVPEFRHGHQRVAALEDRLQAAVSPALQQALQTRNAPQVSRLNESTELQGG